MRLLLVACLIISSSALASAGSLQGAPRAHQICAVDAQNNYTGALLPIPGCTAECDEAARKVEQKVCAPERGKTRTVIEPASGLRMTSIAGSSWQSTVVTSLGQFVGDRAKAEVEAWFEELVREKLCELETAGQKWLPRTCKLLADELGAGQQVDSTLLIEAMRQDVPAFLKGLLDRIKAKLPAAARDVLDAIPVVVKLGSELASGKSPLQILVESARNQEVRAACHARTTDMNGACLLVFAGVTVDYYGPLVASRPRDLDELRSLIVTLLASGEYKSAVCRAFDPAGADCAPGVWGKVPAALQPLVSATILLAAHEDDLKRLFAAIQSAADVQAYLASLGTGPVSEETAREQIATALDLLAPLWTNLGALLWRGQAPATFTAFQHAFAAGGNLARKRYRALVLDLVNLAKASGVTLPEWSTRLMPLIVDIVEAKDSADVTAAFTRAAAPVGGWRLKRQKNVLSITALVGAGGGYEIPTDRMLNGQRLESGLAGGLIAPIGLHGSVAVGSSSSIGVLLSVLDLGQITWSRIEESTMTGDQAGTETLPDVKLSQVFSPGAYLVFGVGLTPFTFGAGVSFAPELREYTFDVSGNRVADSISMYRVGIFAAIDVTLLPLL